MEEVFLNCYGLIPTFEDLRADGVFFYGSVVQGVLTLYLELVFTHKTYKARNTAAYLNFCSMKQQRG